MTLQFGLPPTAAENQESAMREPSPGTAPSVRPPEDRLNSWKEIAAYLNRDVTTVQRWEKREGMPVHRHLHDRMGSVYAFRADLDAWVRSRNVASAQEDEDNAPSPSSPAPPRSAIWTSLTRWTFALPLAAAGAALAPRASLRVQRAGELLGNPLAPPRLHTVTGFACVEHAAARAPAAHLPALLSA